MLVAVKLKVAIAAGLLSGPMMATMFAPATMKTSHDLVDISPANFSISNLTIQNHPDASKTCSSLLGKESAFPFLPWRFRAKGKRLFHLRVVNQELSRHPIILKHAS